MANVGSSSYEDLTPGSFENLTPRMAMHRLMTAVFERRLHLGRHDQSSQAMDKQNVYSEPKAWATRKNAQNLSKNSGHEPRTI